MLRHPRRVLAVAALFIAVFAFLGFGIEGKLNPTSLDVPGTDANRANKLLQQYFGDSAPFAILLQGPPRRSKNRARRWSTRCAPATRK